MLLHNFVTKYRTKRGAIVLGRMAPYGIGAGIGAAANAAFARAMIRATDQAFGALPGARSAAFGQHSCPLSARTLSVRTLRADPT